MYPKELSRTIFHRVSCVPWQLPIHPTISKESGLHIQMRVDLMCFSASLHRITHTEDIRLTPPADSNEKRLDADGDAEGQLGESQQQQSEMRVSHADYKRIASQIVDYISQQETAASGSIEPFQGISSNTVIEWYGFWDPRLRALTHGIWPDTTYMEV